MRCGWLLSAEILTGICTLAVSALAQTYSVSAKPGAVNFIQGDVTINGDPVWNTNLKSTFLNANDLIAVKNGRAEILLDPGVFLRLGQDSQLRMVKPSLIQTQIEVLSGETMLEVDDLVPGSSVSVLDHGAVATLTRNGLYRFTAHSIATLEGRADVVVGDQKLEVKKDKELQLDDPSKVRKLDVSQGDDLYVWSNGRAQANAAATYSGSLDAYNAGGYGYSSFSSPGWYWNSPFNSYMWMPGNGAFYSPFGWGFYGPGVVAYAPVIYAPNYGYNSGYYGGGSGTGPVAKPVAPTTPVTGTGPIKPRPPGISNLTPFYVPVNPRNLPVAQFQGTSPAAFAAARLEMQQAYGYSGLRTINGAPAANLRGGQTFADMRSASRAAATSARANASFGSSSQSSNGGGWSGSRSTSSASAWSASTSRSMASGGGMSRGGSTGGGRSK